VCENSLVETLLNLVKIDGPSRSERSVADYIIQDLQNVGFKVEEDDTKEVVNGNSGNLICYPPFFDSNQPAFMLVAHMDTVRSTAKMEPVIKDGKITSNNEYSIGVDNRAGVTILLEGAKKLIQNSLSKSNVVFVFTVCEEIGPEAAGNLSVPPNVIMGTIYDSSARPGTFIQSTFGANSFLLEIKGKKAHAGVEPEKGINAIYLASKVISNIPVGRISKDLTCNVASINGGGQNNVVPDFVQVKGEIRGSELTQIQNLLNQIENSANEICSNSGGEFTFSNKTNFLPYRIDENENVYRLLTDVYRILKLTPNPIHYSGGSDANEFNQKGLPTINIGIGAQHPHSTEEFILVEDLIMSYRVVTTLIDEFNKRSWS